MLKVLVVGQTPPPFGGQAVMIERLVHSELADVKMVHVRMAFSAHMNEVGRIRMSKVFRLLALISRIVYHRVVDGTRVLYYPPAGAERVPVIRDVVILLATRWMFDKTIFHFHASGLSAMHDRLPRWQRWLFRRAYFGADAAVRISELTPADGRGLAAQREFIVPNGIDDPLRGAEPVRDSGPASAQRPLGLLYVGVLHPAKGVMVLVEACALLAARGVPFRLELMGQPQSDDFMAALKTRIAQLGLEQRIRFLGVLIGPQKTEAFRRADVLCHPTFYDTFPVVLLEAMAMRLPVVATRWSGIPSIVDDEETGLLMEPRDPTALADRLARLADDGQLREQLGSAGRDKFVREFTMPRHIERMRRMFLDVAGVLDVERQEEVADVLVMS